MTGCAFAHIIGRLDRRLNIHVLQSRIIAVAAGKLTTNKSWENRVSGSQARYSVSMAAWLCKICRRSFWWFWKCFKAVQAAEIPENVNRADLQKKSKKGCLQSGV
jgi:hypothetical protein